MRVKDIPGFEGRYLVTDQGDVISVYRPFTDKIGRTSCKPSRVLAAAPDTKGYRVVHLYDNDGRATSAKVHRLVAQAFVDGHGEHINHIDGDRGNNSHTNLEWCSASGNQFHRHARKRHVNLSAGEIMEVRRLYGKKSTKAIADQFNIDRSTVWRLAHGGRHKDAEGAVRRLRKGAEGSQCNPQPRRAS